MDINSKVTISETRFDELKLAEKELKETRYQLDCERQKLETATGLLRARDEEVLCLKKKIETECDKCPAVHERDELKHQLEMKEEQCKSCAALSALRFQCEDIEKERDELRSKLCEMTKYRDECESQFHAKCEELASTIADFNALKEEHAKFTPKPRLQAKVAELTKENEELRNRIELAEMVILGISHKVKCHLQNNGVPSAEETFKCFERTIRAYHEKDIKSFGDTLPSLAKAERCITTAYDAWTKEDGTDKSYDEIGRILREYIKGNSIAM